MEKGLKKIAALILAAGSGRRMGGATEKQYLLVRGESVLKRSVETFARSSMIDLVVVVVRPGDEERASAELPSDFESYGRICSGKETRQESAMAGFEEIPKGYDLVVIHDAARCLVTSNMIESVVKAALEYGAASAGTPVIDTQKITDGEFILSTVPRKNMVAVQTPQAFSYDLYKRALEAAADNVKYFTDDNGLVESLGEKIRFVDTGKYNIKITTPEDLLYAEFLIEKGLCK